MTSGFMVTGAGIPLGQLRAWRGMILEEAKGKKFAGGSVTDKVRAKLEIQGSRTVVLATLDAVIKQHEAALRPGGI